MALLSREYSKINPKDGKKRTNKQQLAWLYQALEFDAISRFAELSGQKALLTTHDCIYFKDKLKSETIVNAKLELQKTYQYLTFEEEEILPIVENEFKDKIYEERDNKVAEHKKRIAEETERAELHFMNKTNSYVASNLQQSNNKSDAASYIDSLMREKNEIEELEKLQEEEHKINMRNYTGNYDKKYNKN